MSPGGKIWGDFYDLTGKLDNLQIYFPPSCQLRIIVIIWGLKLASTVMQVDFDGEHPVEGAKEVGSLMTRYVTRAMRAWEQSVRRQASPQNKVQTWLAKRSSDFRVCPECTPARLQIAHGARGLVVVPVER